MKYFPSKTLELTFAMIKPHIVKMTPIYQEVREQILDKGFYVIKSKRCIMSQQEAAELYGEHVDKFFFIRLTSFMTSGPIECYILARENAINLWRDMLGPTKVFKTQFSHPFSLRGLYGLSDTRNVAHGSDSSKSVERETKIMFPDFDANDWFEKEEIYYRNGFAKFVDDSFVHYSVQDNMPVSITEFNK